MRDEIIAVKSNFLKINEKKEGQLEASEERKKGRLDSWRSEV